MKRAVKGNFGYLAARRRWAVARTILYFAISLSLFTAGYVAAGSKENLLTIVAVLGCLPACKSLVDVIMLFRAAQCSQKVRDATGRESLNTKLFAMTINPPYLMI